MEDPDGPVGPRNKEDRCERVRVDLFLECFGVLHVVRRDIVEPVESSVLGFAGFVSKILNPVGVG